MPYKKKFFCIDCGKEISKPQYKRCRKHARIKFLIDNPDFLKGDNNPHFKNGESIKKHYCKICNKEITYSSFKFGKGFCQSCWQLGNKNNQYKLESEKIKYFCEDCGKELQLYTAKKCEECWYKTPHKNDCNCCSCRAHRGEYKGKNHPCYIDGTGNLPYPLEFTKELKLKIRKRDNYTCQNCGLTNEEHLIVYDRSLTVHHIDYNKENCSEENLISLCVQCNSRANFNRSYWTEFYQNKIAQLNKEAAKNESI